MRPETDPPLTTNHEHKQCINNTEFRVVVAYMGTDKSYRQPVTFSIALQHSLYCINVPVEVKQPDHTSLLICYVFRDTAREIDYRSDLFPHSAIENKA